MNVVTRYNTEAKQIERAMTQRLSVSPPVQPSTIEIVNDQRDRIASLASDNHAHRHSANMAAWCELHNEHMASGDPERIEIANNIMQMKIIPNRS
jgi:hypothetical protein